MNNIDKINADFLAELKEFTFEFSDKKSLESVNINLKVLESERDVDDYSNQLEPSWSSYSWERIKEELSSDVYYSVREKDEELYEYLQGDFEDKIEKISKTIRFKCLKKQIPEFFCGINETVSSDLANSLASRLVGDNSRTLFHETIFYLYKLGVYPCGWIGDELPDSELSNGVLVVFPIEE